ELAIFGLPLFIVGSLLVVWIMQWTSAAFARWLWHADIPERYTRLSGWSWLLRHARAVGAGVTAWLLAMLGLATLHTEWSSGWTLLWCCALMLGCGALVLRRLLPIRGASVAEEMDHAGSGAVQAPHLLNEGEQNTAARRWRLSAPAEEVSDAQRAAVWLLGLVSTAVALIAVCELVYLRDIFDSRMNTVFKLYFQAW